MRSSELSSPVSSRGSRVLRAALVAACASGVAGCFTESGGSEPEDSGIVFGVEHRIDPASGAPEISGGYELLRLGGRGFEVDTVKVVGGSCSLEDLAKRRGRGRIPEGRAIFSGAGLPASGLVVHATDTDVVRAPGAAWSAGDRVKVDIVGFAMPPMAPFSLRVPAPGLVVTAPAADAPLVVGSAEPVTATWSASSVGEGDAVMVALTTGADRDATTGIELRCFFDHAAGVGTIPRDLVAAFVTRAATEPSAIGGGVAGRFVVASHRQATFVGRGDWVAYVVATSVAREQPFVLPSR